MIWQLKQVIQSIFIMKLTCIGSSAYYDSKGNTALYTIMKEARCDATRDALVRIVSRFECESMIIDKCSGYYITDDVRTVFFLNIFFVSIVTCSSLKHRYTVPDKSVDH